MNYSYLDQSPIDLSTAPSSSSNYFLQQQQQQQYANSPQFWRNQQPNQPRNSNNNYLNNSSNGNISNMNTNNSDKELEALKIDLRIKESQIESLESELNRLTDFDRLQSSNPAETQIPKTFEEVFKRLSENNANLKAELNDTKKRLESLVLAISLNPSNASTNDGRYDELEISHKVILKLDNLVKENENLLKNLSFGKLKEYQIEINLLKLQNAKLLEKLSKYEDVDELTKK